MRMKIYEAHVQEIATFASNIAELINSAASMSSTKKWHNWLDRPLKFSNRGQVWVCVDSTTEEKLWNNILLIGIDGRRIVATLDGKILSEGENGSITNQDYREGFIRQLVGETRHFEENILYMSIENDWLTT